MSSETIQQGRWFGVVVEIGMGGGGRGPYFVNISKRGIENFAVTSKKVEHPAVRFQAPGFIQRGVPLKEVLGGDLIRLIGESIASVAPKFDQDLFVQTAMEGLAGLELNQRAKHIGQAMANQLPNRFAQANRILLASFGPELSQTGGNGLAPFFYLPHAHFIMDQGMGEWEHGMKANYELTKRFSAEFSVRPFLIRYREESLDLLKTWTTDSNPHVRRLVSEGTRPRLPWAMRLKDFQQDPKFTLPLLDILKDDPELYVRRSVANHLADILKDHPDCAFGVCDRWLKEVNQKKFPADVTKARKWIVRHAVRLPAKKGDSRALDLRARAK